MTCGCCWCSGWTDGWTDHAWQQKCENHNELVFIAPAPATHNKSAKINRSREAEVCTWQAACIYCSSCSLCIFKTLGTPAASCTTTRAVFLSIHNSQPCLSTMCTGTRLRVPAWCHIRQESYIFCHNMSQGQVQTASTFLLQCTASGLAWHMLAATRSARGVKLTMLCTLQHVRAYAFHTARCSTEIIDGLQACNMQDV